MLTLILPKILAFAPVELGYSYFTFWKELSIINLIKYYTLYS